MTGMLDLNDQNFDSEVISSHEPVIVDFWAEWCGPCKAISPIVEEIAGEYAGKIKVGKVNVDYANNTASRYGFAPSPPYCSSRVARWWTRSSARCPRERFSRRSRRCSHSTAVRKGQTRVRLVPLTTKLLVLW